MPIQFDIDIDRKKVDDDELFEQMKGEKYAQEMVKDAIKMFQFEGLEYELINRTREDKISYHLRFAGKNWSYVMYASLNTEMANIRKRLAKNRELNVKNRKNKKHV